MRAEQASWSHKAQYLGEDSHFVRSMRWALSSPTKYLYAAWVAASSFFATLRLQVVTVVTYLILQAFLVVTGARRNRGSYHLIIL